jgi:hypothetical protein
MGKGGCLFELTYFVLMYSKLLLERRNAYKIFNFDVKMLSG